MKSSTGFYRLLLVRIVVLMSANFCFSQTDLGNPWTFDTYQVNNGRFSIYNLGRQYSGESSSQIIFGELSVFGAKINGQSPVNISRIFSAPTYTQGQWDQYRLEVYDQIYGQFLVGTQNHIMEVLFKLYRNGRLEIVASFRNQSGVYAGYADEIYIRADYDITPYTTNMVEYTTTGTNPIYFAPANETKISWTGALPAGGVESPIYCRFFNSNDRDKQIFGTLAPGGSGTNPIDIFFKKYQSGVTLPPKFTSTTSLQGVSTVPAPYSTTYAHTGKDQMIDLTLKRISATNVGYSLIWKVFRRPDGRPIRLNWTTMNDLYNPFTNNDLFSITSSGNAIASCNGRSFMDAMRQLVGPSNTALPVNVIINGPQIVPDPYPIYALPGSACPNANTAIHRWSTAELHNFITSNRSLPPLSAEDYGAYNVDVAQVNGVWANDEMASGVMFDRTGLSNTPPYKEGVAILMANMQCGYVPGNKLEPITVFAHEIAHTLGMSHSWTQSLSGSCQTIECNPCNDPSNPYPLLFSDQNLGFWFKNGPESLVKPGKYSTDWIGSSFPVNFRLPGGSCHVFNPPNGTCP